MNPPAGWETLLWTLWVTALIIFVIGAGLVIFVGYKLYQKGFRRFRSFGGTLKLFGQELAFNADLDTERDKQLGEMDARLLHVEEAVKRLLEAESDNAGGELGSKEAATTEGGAGAPESGDRAPE